MGETLNSKCLPTLTKIGVFRHHSWKIFAPVGPFKRQMFEYKDCTIKYSKQWGLKKKPSCQNLIKSYQWPWQTKTKRLLLRFVLYLQYLNIPVISTGTIFCIMLSSTVINIIWRSILHSWMNISIMCRIVKF